MKYLFAILLILLFVAGCSPTVSNQVTVEDNEITNAEIDAEISDVLIDETSEVEIGDMI